MPLIRPVLRRRRRRYVRRADHVFKLPDTSWLGEVSWPWPDWWAHRSDVTAFEAICAANTAARRDGLV